MRRLIVLTSVLVALAAAASAQAASAGKPLPCTRYVPNFGVNAITNPPTWKCAVTINSWYLDCLIDAQEKENVSGATCFKLRAATKYALIYATGVSRRTKRNALIDYEGVIDGLCDTYGSLYCSEVASIEREIRKLS